MEDLRYKLGTDMQLPNPELAKEFAQKFDDRKEEILGETDDLGTEDKICR